MKDIYSGESINVWEDEGIVYMSISSNGVLLSFSNEEWAALKSDFDILINGEPNHNPAG